MADIFYADQTSVILGEDFSTDFRYARVAVLTPVVTYWQVGPTLNLLAPDGNQNTKAWSYKCGPYQVRSPVWTASEAPFPTNTTIEVAF